MKSGPVTRRKPVAGSRLIVCLLQVALFSAFAAVKLTSAWGAAPVLTGDKRIWYAISLDPLLSWDFLFPRRPPVLPLLYKLVGDSDEMIVRVQIVLSIVAWGLRVFLRLGALTGLACFLSLSHECVAWFARRRTPAMVATP